MSSVLQPARSLGRARASRLRLLLVVLALLVTGCRFGPEPTPTPPASASPTGTLTPAGDVLRIDGVPVRRVVIPSPDVGPLYAIAGDTLFVQDQETWTPIGTDRFARRYLVDPEDIDRVFRGRHRRCGTSPPETDIPMEVSKDGGLHWRQLTLGTNIEPILFDPNDHDVIYGAECSMLVVSTNAGNTWDRVDVLPGHFIVDVRMIGTRLLVLGTNPAGISTLVPIDVTNPHEPEVGDVLLIADGQARMDATPERIVVGGAGIVHSSDDGGQTWTRKVALVEEETDESAESVPTPVRVPLARVLSLRIGPSSIPRLYAGTQSGLLVSQDDGLTWVHYEEVPPTAIVTEIQFGLANADLYITTDPGVIMVPAP